MSRPGETRRQSEAEAMLDRGFFKQAELRLRSDVQEDPTNPWLLALLGRALIHQGDFEEGEPLLDRARELAPDDPEILAEWSTLPVLKERPHEALAILDRAAAGLPDNAGILSRRGLTLLGLDEMEEAEALFRKAIAIEPGQVRGHAGLGRLLQQQGRLQEAAAMLLCITDCSKLVNGWLAEIYCNLAEYGKALRSAELEIRTNPENLYARCSQAYALAFLDREEEAFEVLEELDQHCEDPMLAPSTRTMIFFDQQRWEQALPCLEEMVGFSPDDSTWRRRLALCLDALGRTYDAQEQFVEALSWDPESRETLEAFILFCEKHQWHVEAIKLRTKLVQENPGDETACFDLLLANYRYGAIRSALELWRETRGRTLAFLPMSCASRAHFLIDNNRLDDALETIRLFNEFSALEADPLRLHVKISPSGLADGIGVENAPQRTLEMIRAALPLADIDPSNDHLANYGLLADGSFRRPGRISIIPVYTRAQLLALQTEADRRWTTSISRSRRRPGCFYVRQSSSPRGRWPEDWGKLRQICSRLGVWYETQGSCGPIGPESWELNAVFLDGGLVARDGTYAPTCGPPPGAWIVGETALRFACYVLGLIQPRRFSTESRVPQFRELCETILMQRRLPEKVLRSRFQLLEASYKYVFTFRG